MDFGNWSKEIDLRKSAGSAGELESSGFKCTEYRRIRIQNSAKLCVTAAEVYYLSFSFLIKLNPHHPQAKNACINEKCERIRMMKILLS